jgi:hypothetical protein
MQNEIGLNDQNKFEYEDSWSSLINEFNHLTVYRIQNKRQSIRNILTNLLNREKIFFYSLINNKK